MLWACNQVAYFKSDNEHSKHAAPNDFIMFFCCPWLQLHMWSVHKGQIRAAWPCPSMAALQKLLWFAIFFCVLSCLPANITEIPILFKKLFDMLYLWLILLLLASGDLREDFHQFESRLHSETQSLKTKKSNYLHTVHTESAWKSISCDNCGTSSGKHHPDQNPLMQLTEPANLSLRSVPCLFSLSVLFLWPCPGFAVVLCLSV